MLGAWRAIASGPDSTCLRAENESLKRTFKLHFKHKAETGVPHPGILHRRPWVKTSSPAILKRVMSDLVWVSVANKEFTTCFLSNHGQAAYLPKSQGLTGQDM